MVKNPAEAGERAGSAAGAIAWSVFGVGAAALVVTLIASAGHGWLPVLKSQGQYTAALNAIIGNPGNTKTAKRVDPRAALGLSIRRSDRFHPAPV